MKIRLRLNRFRFFVGLAVFAFVGCAMGYSTVRTYPFLREMSMPSIVDSMEETMHKIGYEVEKVAQNETAAQMTGKKTANGKTIYLTVWVPEDRRGIFAESHHWKDVGLFLDAFKESAKPSSPAMRQAWLGVSLQSMTEELAGSLSLDEARGALIVEVVEESPASKAGLMPEDIILEIERNPVFIAEDLVNAVKALSPGSRLVLKVWRKGISLNKIVTLAAPPIGSGDEINRAGVPSSPAPGSGPKAFGAGKK